MLNPLDKKKCPWPSKSVLLPILGGNVRPYQRCIENDMPPFRNVGEEHCLHILLAGLEGDQKDTPQSRKVKVLDMLPITGRLGESLSES
jgi:hypothetical protein